jgi:hypothetical protein
VGLAIEVGMLADLLSNDQEGAGWFREDMEKLNSVLTMAGLAPHDEPKEGAVHSTDMYGYSGLHYLRRCAAHLHYRGALPPPLIEGESPAEDEELERYCADFVAENIEVQPGSFALETSRPFDHLILHSDAEGFYVPQSFKPVLLAGDHAYGWIGSSQTLRSECERLAEAFELPGDILNDPENEALFEAIESSRNGAKVWRLFKPRPAIQPAWRDHPIAALICAKLYCFAGYSIQTKAALVFC